MVSLNHTNLTTYDVPALQEFFCSVFAFEVIERRSDKLAVLTNADGFLLTLMFHKDMNTEHGYPGLFHIGFLQPTVHVVDQIHQGMKARRYVAHSPALLRRGGPPTYGFYYQAPGGVLVEVSTTKIEESNSKSGETDAT